MGTDSVSTELLDLLWASYSDSGVAKESAF